MTTNTRFHLVGGFFLSNSQATWAAEQYRWPTSFPKRKLFPKCGRDSREVGHPVNVSTSSTSLWGQEYSKPVFKGDKNSRKHIGINTYIEEMCLYQKYVSEHGGISRGTPKFLGEVPQTAVPGTFQRHQRCSNVHLVSNMILNIFSPSIPGDLISAWSVTA